MSTFKTYNYSSGKSFYEKLLGSLVFLIFIGLLLYLFFQFYKLMWYVCPLLLIIALILEPKVIGSYFKNIWIQIKENPLAGLIQAGINIIGLPFVSLGLIFKAWVYKKFGRLNDPANQDSFEDKFTPFEEINIEKRPSSQTKKPVISDGRYDDLFE